MVVVIRLCFVVVVEMMRMRAVVVVVVVGMFLSGMMTFLSFFLVCVYVCV